MKEIRLRRRRRKLKKKIAPLDDNTDQDLGLSLGSMMKIPVKPQAAQRCFPVFLPISSMARSL